MTDDQVVYKRGRVTGTIKPGQTGEVVIAIRGGTEAFNAHAYHTGDVIPLHSKVIIVEFTPPRTVYVTLEE